VAVCQHEELLVERLELLFQPDFEKLARELCEDIRAVSPETTVRCHQLPLSDAWDFEAVYAGLHDFARGYPFAPEREDYLVHISTGTHVAQICLFLLTEARYLPGRLIQTSPGQGAERVPGSYRIIDLDLSRYDRLHRRFQREQADSVDFLKAGIPTRNAAFNAMMAAVETVALRSRSPILLSGPTGAGKTQLARRIYQLKHDRRQLHGPLVETNCATLRGDTAQSLLFGHRRGAFTGAVTDREGLLARADGGLLFLDEIGELGLDEQAMLLRALEEGLFLPVGADRETDSRFQLIAGSNRDLAGAVAVGRFREDLLARIDLWHFHLPGLADRREDIEPNLAVELERFAREHNLRVTFNREARERYLAFALSPAAPWRGNFRDLAASVTRMGTLARGGRIDEAGVAAEIARLRQRWGEDAAADDDGLTALLGSQRLAELDRVERVQLAEVVRVCRASPSLSAAGRVLFQASRARKDNPNDADRLRKYLARHGLRWEQLSDRDG